MTVQRIGEGRRLVAILAADVVGSARLMAEDESAALERLQALRSDVLEPAFARHGGRLFKTMGDGFLASFPSAVEALRCALSVQEVMDTGDRGLALRIGVHQGDVVFAEDGSDLLGDGVNVAARLEALAEPGGVAISARVREDAAGKLELEAEDLGERDLKNIPRPVRVFRVRVAHASRQGSDRYMPPESARLAVADRPALVVLPFQNMSGDAEQEYFVDGMVEDITTALSRTRWFFVIARNTAFTYKGKAVDVRRIGRELGVRYVLEGSVRKSGGRMRITGQLIDAETGHHVWADRFDGALDDVFDLQDRITANVVGAIAPQIFFAEVKRSQRKPPDSLQAYDLRLRALAHFDALSCEAMAHSADLARQATEMDPNYALGHAALAWCLWRQVSQGCLQDNGPATHEALACANKAFSLQPDDPEVLAVAGWLVGTVSGDRERGLALIEKSLRLNPNSPGTLRSAANLYAYLGEVDTVLGYVERATRLDPFGEGIPMGNLAVAIAYFANGRYAETLEATAAVLRDRPDIAPALRYRAASLGLLERITEGQAVVARLNAIVPDFSTTRARSHLENDMNRPFKNPHVIDALCEGLSRLGVPA